MAVQRIGVIGSGPVGQALADGFLKHGYEVMRGSREPGKLAEWRQKSGARASTGAFDETARHGEIVVLAVKGTAAESAVAGCGAANLAGKVVIDTTNPIAEAPPVNGVLRFFTTLDQSLMERLQTQVPAARFVKAFSCVGNGLMVNPRLPGGPPTMFMCGNDDGAKTEVKTILTQFGWEISDLGKAEAARAIEPLCILWCIPGFLENDWMHALKVLKK
jgi:8-hydroxy-5-deazaflavin:NADPH oxidoreductase